MRKSGFILLLMLAFFPTMRGFTDQFDSAIGLVTLTSGHDVRTSVESRASIKNLTPDELQRLLVWSKILAAAPKPLVANQPPLAEVFQMRYAKMPAR